MPSRDHMLGFVGVVDWIPEAKPLPRASYTPARERVPVSQKSVVDAAQVRHHDRAGFPAKAAPAKAAKKPAAATLRDEYAWQSEGVPTEPGAYCLRGPSRECDLDIDERGLCHMRNLRPIGESRDTCSKVIRARSPMKRLAKGVEWRRRLPHE